MQVCQGRGFLRGRLEVCGGAWEEHIKHQKRQAFVMWPGTRDAHQVRQVIVGQAETEQLINGPASEAEGRCSMKLLLGAGWWNAGPEEGGDRPEGSTAQLLAAVLVHVKEHRAAGLEGAIPLHSIMSKGKTAGGAKTHLQDEIPR